MSLLNVSAYRFVALPDPQGLAGPLRERLQAAGARGTVLLAHEGINLFLAGEAGPLRDTLAWLCAGMDGRLPAQALAGLDVKESLSDALPFGRLKVKVKTEIIRMNQPAVQPAGGRAPAVDAATLARWLDQGHDDDGRPVVMLDTRNAWEVARGRFAGAVDWVPTRFGEFPQAWQQHAAELQGRTVVSYCTGGIRCEKAALYMADHLPPGTRVLQLDGGILRWFEHTGGRHYQGDCVVFDERGALAADLAPAPVHARAAAQDHRPCAGRAAPAPQQRSRRHRL